MRVIGRMAGVGWAISLLAGGMALAQPAPASGPPPPSAPAMAPGRDGPETLAQFQAHQRERVMRADTDGDGRVSLQEWSAAHPPRGDDGGGGGGGHRGWGRDPAAQFARMDLDHDGFLTPAEIDAASAARFNRMDRNHDGVLTPDERHGGWGGARGGGEGGGTPPDH